MLSMLRWSIEFIALLLASYLGWLALAASATLLVLTGSNSIRRQSMRLERATGPFVLLLLAICPFLTLIAGAVLWKKWEDPSFVPLMPESISTSLVSALALLQVPCAVWVVWRRRPMTVVETMTVLFSLMWAWSCAVVSTMAATGNWL